MKIHRPAYVILLLATIAFLSACGGGSSSQTPTQLPATVVSGIAATGAPIQGTVTLKDRDGLTRGPVATGSDGSFSFEVTGLAPPFVLKAEWTSGLQTQALFAVATQAGTVHINPLSNLALAFATGADPVAVFGASDAPPDTAAISDTTMAAAVGQMKTLLTPLLNDYGITEFNPLNGNYTATPDNRLDAMLDVIAVKAENGQVTISNRLTGTAIASGSATNPAGIVLDKAKCPDKGALDDVRDITQRVGALGEAMKLGAALTTTALEGFFVPDPDYGTSNGHTRTQDIASIVAIFGPGGSNTNGALKVLRNVRLVSDLTAKYTGRGVTKVYLLNYDFIFENGKTVRGNNVTFGKETASGLWKFIGDPVGQVAGSNYGGYDAASNHGGWIKGSFTGGYSTGVWKNLGPVDGDVVIVPFPPLGEGGTTENAFCSSWQVLKSGSIVEISYKIQGDFVPYAEFDLDIGALRLRHGAGAGWSPSAILRPSFQGENAAYQGAPVTATWAVAEASASNQSECSLAAAAGVILYFQWNDDDKNAGAGMVRFTPPGDEGFSASVIYVGKADPAQATKFLLLTLVSDPIPAAHVADQTVSIGGQTVAIPQDGWFVEPSLGGRDLTWNGRPAGVSAATPTLTVSFNQDMAMSGQAVAAADALSSKVRLYVESDRYHQEIGMAEGSYTLAAKP